jgi:hypothetical protein
MSSFSIRFVLIALIALTTTTAFAGIDQAPPSFPYRDGAAVFVDFEKASYHLVYDFAAKSVNVESEIVFDAPKAGYPIFDLVPEPTNVRLDDRDTETGEIADPDQASHFRVVRTLVSPGSHRLTLSHRLTNNVDFRADGVASAFWTTDLTDRHYLEQYLPTNFEFDQYPMTMRIEIVNAPNFPHELRANGAVKNPAPNVFEVEFPAFYTASSVFFHLSPKGSIPSVHFTVKSVDGRDLPVEVYSRGNLNAYASEVRRVIAELEGDYGPFPHAKVIVYGAGSGGMEYSGATVSSASAVGHELFHSYNARGVMPARGNAGWIDEAMSSWRDDHYRLRRSPGGKTRMAGHSVWTRMTDDEAYDEGADFLAWIAGRMEAEGKDFKAFLREYYRANMYHTETTDMLEKAMEAYGGFDLAADFDTYIYGNSRTAEPSDHPGSSWPEKFLEACHSQTERPILENPFHPRLTREELFELL